MRILHTGDWHLGRIFHGIHLTNDQAYLLDQFVSLVHDTSPDAVLIAGDVYDRGVPPTDAVQLLDETVSRIIIDCRTPLLLIAGNHDSPQRLRFGNKLLARQELFICGSPLDYPSPLVLYDQSGPVYFSLLPFTEPGTLRQWLALPEGTDQNNATNALIKKHLAEIPQGVRKVALAHAYVSGGTVSESERPLSIGGVSPMETDSFRDYHYVALGHLHQAQQLGTNLFYSGSLLKYSFSEVHHRKSVSLMEIDETGQLSLEKISLTPRRDLRTITGYFADILANPPTEFSREDYLMVTLKDDGPILDAISRLREIFPNILHIERPALQSRGQIPEPGGDHRQTGDLDLFSTFFTQVTGNDLTEDEAKVFAATVSTYVTREDK